MGPEQMMQKLVSLCEYKFSLHRIGESVFLAVAPDGYSAQCTVSRNAEGTDEAFREKAYELDSRYVEHLMEGWNG